MVLPTRSPRTPAIDPVPNLMPRIGSVAQTVKPVVREKLLDAEFNSRTRAQEDVVACATLTRVALGGEASDRLHLVPLAAHRQKKGPRTCNVNHPTDGGSGTADASNGWGPKGVDSSIKLVSNLLASIAHSSAVLATAACIVVGTHLI